MAQPARASRLAEVDLPDFGSPQMIEELPASIYGERLGRLREAMDRRGYERLVVYADREHSANLSYLTGFDPRFEEALLVVGLLDDPLVLVGNECGGLAEAAPSDMRVELFQDFSLPSQPRDKSRSLMDIFCSEGLDTSKRVGVVGWKVFSKPGLIDIPTFIADDLRAVVGDSGTVENATALLIDASEGLRVINEVEQLACFESAACHTSSAVLRVLKGLEPGMSEHEAAALLGWNGSPLSCHLMLTAGERARLGLLSPGDRRISRGDPFTVAYGIWGALNCRAGFVVEDSDELPAVIGDYVGRLVAPYFDAVGEWYAALHIGQTGGALHEIIDRRLADPFFGIFLNPGHQIHLDEWVNSPIGPDSAIELRSGMALQVDIIPATGTRYFTTNIEDGIALADASLRAEFAVRYPEAWGRIQARRGFMRDGLGIELHPDVLPFSNIPAYLPPFLMRPDRVMTFA